MTLTFTILVSVFLLILFLCACCYDNDGGLIGLTCLLGFIWVLFGLLLASGITKNPDYPVEYNTVQVTGVADIPQGGFILFLERVMDRDKEIRFTRISELPLHDAKVVVFENYRDTWGNPIHIGINVAKTLEANSTNNKK